MHDPTYCCSTKFTLVLKTAVYMHDHNTLEGRRPNVPLPEINMLQNK